MQRFLRDTFGLQEDVHFLHFLAGVFLLTIGVMLLISKLKPAKTAYVESYSHDVEIVPWKHAKLAGAVISFITVAFYVFLAQ